MMTQLTRGHYRRYSDQLRVRVMAALLLGEPVRQVAAQFNIPRTTVRNWRKEAMAYIDPGTRQRAGEALKKLRSSFLGPIGSNGKR